MPVALGGLAGVAVALLAALLAISVWVLMRAIGNSIGNIRIGPFVAHVGSWFAGIGNSVANWIVDQVRDSWSELTNWFLGHAYLITQLSREVVNVTRHLGDQIAHIVNVVIPDAVNSAGNYADRQITTAISEVHAEVRNAHDAISQALSAADRSIYEAVARVRSTVAGDLKSIASHVADVAQNYTDGAVHDLRKWTEHGISDAESTAAKATSDLAKKIGGEISDLSDTVARNLRTAESYALAQATRVEGIAAKEFKDAEDYARQQAADALAEAEKGIAAAREYAAGQAADALKTATDEISTAKDALSKGIAAADTLAQTAINNAAADLTAAEQYAAGQASSAESAAVTAGTAAASQALGTAVGTLQDALGGVYTDLTGKAIAAGGDLSTIEGLLAGAITGAVAAVATRVTSLERCAVTTCDGPNQLSGLLQGLLGLAEFAGVGAFLAELIDNPEKAVGEYAGAIEGTYSAGQSALQALLSI